MSLNGTLTDIEGLRVGHAHDLERGITGCTVILLPPETVGGVDQRGGAPGTRETDLLRPMHLVQHPHAIFLAGGSAFGLSVGDGVMRYLESKGIGYGVADLHIPIVSGAILFDLHIGDPQIRPDAALGYAACEAASDAPVLQGSVGAGTGATVGKLLGKEFSTKGGIGSASIALEDGLIVAALFAVNAIGDVIDAEGQIIAGVRQPPDGRYFADTLHILRERHNAPPPNASNTVIGVVATNARLTKEETNWLASMAQAGLARAVHPSHTPYDGDTIFSLATRSYTKPANLMLIGALGAEVVAQAIRNGVYQARTLGGIPALADL